MQVVVESILECSVNGSFHVIQVFKELCFSEQVNPFHNGIMSDDLLFRWNLTIHLNCEKCNNTMFVEEVGTGEIFCVTCGMSY